MMRASAQLRANALVTGTDSPCTRRGRTASGRASRVARGATFGAAFAMALVTVLLAPESAWARPSPESTVAQGIDFGLPFVEPPGLGSWYLAQPYGNTIYAYYERATIYRAGQGLHMGMDFAAACGTPIAAVADGTVRSVDGPGGALPHNMMISHAGGIVSFYGHLLERPALAVGQTVTKGQAIALSGDMYETCYASPHLHLEIRDESLRRAFNPVHFIDADWHGLALLGASPQRFERNLEDPRRWQAMDDQPEITFGGPLLNNFVHALPADGS